MNVETKLSVKILVSIIATILSFVCYFIASKIGINGRITLLVLSSASLCAIVISAGLYAAIAAYIVLALTAFSIGDVNMVQALYVVIFALYPLLKSVYERNPSQVRMYIIKGFTFLGLAFAIIVLKQVYSFKLYLYFIIVVAGFIYDFLLTMFIMVYSHCRMVLHGYDPYAPEEVINNY